MILPIIAYGDPILRKVGTEIDKEYPKLATLIANMKETMYNASGVGLAAPQIGLAIRLFIIDASPFAEDVSRQPKITIEYQDEDFKTHTEVLEGLAARVFQHEYDHIEGILFTDKLSTLKKRLLKKRLENISKGKINADYRMNFPNLKKGK